MSIGNIKKPWLRRTVLVLAIVPLLAMFFLVSLLAAMADMIEDVWPRAVDAWRGRP